MAALSRMRESAINTAMFCLLSKTRRQDVHGWALC